MTPSDVRHWAEALLREVERHHDLRDLPLTQARAALWAAERIGPTPWHDIVWRPSERERLLDLAARADRMGYPLRARAFEAIVAVRDLITEVSEQMARSPGRWHIHKPRTDRGMAATVAMALACSGGLVGRPR